MKKTKSKNEAAENLKEALAAKQEKEAAAQAANAARSIVMPVIGNRIIREAERLAKTGLSDTQWWRLEKQGRVPRRIKLGEHAIGWYQHEIDQWLEERAALRSA